MIFVVDFLEGMGVGFFFVCVCVCVSVCISLYVQKCQLSCECKHVDFSCNHVDFSIHTGLRVGAIYVIV